MCRLIKNRGTVTQTCQDVMIKVRFVGKTRIIIQNCRSWIKDKLCSVLNDENHGWSKGLWSNVFVDYRVLRSEFVKSFRAFKVYLDYIQSSHVKDIFARYFYFVIFTNTVSTINMASFSCKNTILFSFHLAVFRAFFRTICFRCFRLALFFRFTSFPSALRVIFFFLRVFYLKHPTDVL